MFRLVSWNECAENKIHEVYTSEYQQKKIMKNVHTAGDNSVKQQIKAGMVSVLFFMELHCFSVKEEKR